MCSLILLNNVESENFTIFLTFDGHFKKLYPRDVTCCQTNKHIFEDWGLTYWDTHEKDAFNKQDAINNKQLR